MFTNIASEKLWPHCDGPLTCIQSKASWNGHKAGLEIAVSDCLMLLVFVGFPIREIPQ